MIYTADAYIDTGTTEQSLENPAYGGYQAHQ